MKKMQISREKRTTLWSVKGVDVKIFEMNTWYNTFGKLQISSNIKCCIMIFLAWGIQIICLGDVYGQK